MYQWREQKVRVGDRIETIRVRTMDFDEPSADAAEPAQPEPAQPEPAPVREPKPAKAKP